MLSFSQCEYFPHITVQLSIWQCLHFLFLFTMWIFSSITLQLSIYNVEIKFHCFHTVLFTITLPSIPTVLFTFAFLFTMWTFFHSYCIIVYSTMFTVRLHRIHIVLFTITLPSILTLMFPCAFIFTMWIFPHITALVSIWQYLHRIFSVYMLYCLQLLSPVNWWFCVYIYFPFHNDNVLTICNNDYSERSSFT